MMKRILGILTLLFLIVLSQQHAHAQAQTETTETYVPCSHRGHVECIRITGREVFQHGAEGRWSEHWWRMSYIGRACEERLGRPKGVALETLFALPHYMAMGVMNVAGLTKHALSKKRDRSDSEKEKTGLSSSE
jgi:hypothetical protein